MTTGIPLAHIGGVPVVEGAALVLIVAVPVIAIVLAVVLGGRMLAKVEAEKAAQDAENLAAEGETTSEQET
ncbi:hypothetical protein [Smaragdicoccus niigatensis]|uniref:hypothetical protein n=1 Tax=Smaragdicoccus niigatensis TaxID=359359 RepID=UPI0003A0E900|nr:hypothetical protein [Smaragdicoccus niigatensis]